MNRTRRWISALAVLLLSALACNLPGGTSTPTITETPAKNAEPPNVAGSLSGAIWHDLCALPDGPLPNPLPTGCVPTGNGGAMANGTRDGDEPGISDVVVDLHSGDCNGTVLASISTDVNGAFNFSNLPDGIYCIAIDLANEVNQKVLIPGAWTHPTTISSVVSLTDTIQNGSALTGLNFGWDYQFLPEVGSTAQNTATATTAPPPPAAPQQAVFTVDTAANCRAGPGTVYSIITSYPVGTTLTIIGRNDSSTWWLVQISASQSCWISGVTGHTSGNTGGVSVVAAPPTPVPTFTPTTVAGDSTPPVLNGPVAVYTDLYYPTANCAANIFVVAIRAQDDHLDSVWLKYRVLGDGGYVGSWNTLNPNDNASGGLYGFNYDLNAQFAGELGGSEGTIQYQFFAKDQSGNSASYPDGFVLGIPLHFCP